MGSTAIAAEMGNSRWGELVARHHRLLRRLIGRFGGHEIDTAGDGFFVTFERPADVDQLCRRGHRGRPRARDRDQGRRELRRARDGRTEAGRPRREHGRAGDGVAGPGEVLVPASVKDIVPASGIAFVEHGVHQFKGFDGDFRLFKRDRRRRPAAAPPLEEEVAAERRREIFPREDDAGPLIVGRRRWRLALIVAAALVVPRRWGRNRPHREARCPSATRWRASTPRPGVSVRPMFIEAMESVPQRPLFIDHPLAVGEGGVWLMRPPRLLHIDPLDGGPAIGRIEVGVGTSQSVDSGLDAVWVLTAAPSIRSTRGPMNPGRSWSSAPAGIATSASRSRRLWVGDSDGTLVRVDPATGARDQMDTRLSIGRDGRRPKRLWVADILGGWCTVRPETLRPTGASRGRREHRPDGRPRR